MEKSPLNEKPLEVFVILAEKLSGWKELSTSEGKNVLLEHYAWGAALKKENKLLIAGPLDAELTTSGTKMLIGRTTGLIMLRASNRTEAEELAFRDPFHRNGFRRNEVHSMKISMTADELFVPLEQAIK